MTDWVSQHEFSRLEGTVNEIHGDVKLLLAARNQEIGAHSERREILDATRDRGARKLGWGAIVVAVLSSLGWVQDAIARAIH